MSTLSYTILIFLAIVFALVDTSFLSFFEIWHATVLLTFQAVLAFALIGFRKYLIIFSAVSILLYASLSSVPVLFLVFAFLLIPLFLVYTREKIAYESNFPLILLTLLIANLIFQAGLILMILDFSSSALTSLASFSVINSIGGIVLYYMIAYVKNMFRIEAK